MATVVAVAEWAAWAAWITDPFSAPSPACGRGLGGGQGSCLEVTKSPASAGLFLGANLSRIEDPDIPREYCDSASLGTEVG